MDVSFGLRDGYFIFPFMLQRMVLSPAEEFALENT